MAPSGATQTDDSCCHRSVLQFGEIKNELKNIRQTVDVAVKLLSKLVGLTPSDIQALVNSNGVSTPTSLPVVDCLSVVSFVSDNGLRTDTAKEPMDIPSQQTSITEGVSTTVETAVKAKNGKTAIHTETEEIIVEAENDETRINSENDKSTIELESNKTLEAKNNKTTVEAGSDRVKDDVVLNINMQSKHLTAFVKTNLSNKPVSKNEAANSAKDCATILGHSVTFESQAIVANPDMSVHAVRSESKGAKTDTTIPAHTMQLPSLSDVNASQMLPATCDFSVSALQNVCTNSVGAKTAMTSTEAGLSSMKVKQEQPSEYDDTDLSTFAVSVEERLKQHDEVKMDPEGVFISDAMLPVCVLVKREDGFCTSNTHENNITSHTGSNSTEQLSGQSSVVNTSDKLIKCSKNQGVGHMVQDPPYQVTSPLRPLLGSALVSKLKQKIQEKIQAAVYAVNEEKEVNESEHDNLVNTNKCIEISCSFSKDSKHLKESKITKGKFRQKFYQCRSCAKTFFCKVALHVHKNHCRGLQKQYHCSSCPLIFKSRAVLFNHRQLHSAKKSNGRHKCEMCGREFILKSTLKKHRQSQVCKGTRMKCYRKLPQYFCGECGEGFLNSSNLELHQKLHRVDKTHSSSGVLKSTDSGNQGVPAVATRTVRRYPCSYCDEAFIDRRSVTLHEKLHTDKEFAAFDQERKMIQRRHQLTMMLQKQQQQSNRKKFGCDVCGRCYSIELLLHMHTRLHHAIS